VYVLQGMNDAKEDVQAVAVEGFAVFAHTAGTGTLSTALNRQAAVLNAEQHHKV
jgi:hypothetical protein